MVNNMKQYKGYYIDKVIFNNKKEIDDFIKDQTIKEYKQLCKRFENDACMELIDIMASYQDKLHNDFGLSYEEIENIEIEAIEVA